MNRRINYDEYLDWLEKFMLIPTNHSIGFSFSSTFNLGQSDSELLSSRDDEDILDHIQAHYVLPDDDISNWPVYDEALGG